MNTRHTATVRLHAAAFVLALATTLAMLSGVNSLSAQSPLSGAVLVQAQAAPSRA